MTYDDLAARIAKLPGWAREHIDRITRERDRAVEQLKRSLDGQTKTSFYAEQIAQVPGHIARRYLDAMDVTCVRDNVKVTMNRPDRQPGITVYFDLIRKSGRCAVLPEASNYVRIVELPDGD